MRYIKLYENFRRHNLQLLLEAVLNIDTNIEQSLKKIRDDKSANDSHRKISEIILNSINKNFSKLKYDSIGLNPEKKEDFLLMGKIGKQNLEQSVSKVINNLISSIYDTEKSLPKYLVKKTGGRDIIPKVGTLLTEDEYQKIISQFTKEEIEENKKTRPQEEKKFIIDNLSGGAIVDDFSRILSVKISQKPKTESNIKLVSGEEIIKWYDTNNTVYVSGSTLANSCMKGSLKSKFLRIYVDNPEKIQLLIKLDNNDKLVARAFVWKLDYSEGDMNYFMDRCYYNEFEDQENIYDWLINQPEYKNCGRKIGEVDNMIVKLNNVLFKSYPYLDTFRFLHIKSSNKSQKGKLVNEGFISNMGQNTLGYDKITSKLSINTDEYIDFRLDSADGSRKAVDPDFDDFNIEIKTVKIIEGIKDEIKNTLLPSGNYLNELKNLLKVVEILQRTGDPSSILHIKEITEDETVPEDLYALTGDIYIGKDLAVETQGGGDIEKIIGFRVFGYQIPLSKKSLIESKLLEKGVESVSLSTDKFELRMNEQRFFLERPSVHRELCISALELDILGILEIFKNEKPLFLESYDTAYYFKKNSKFIEEFTKNSGDAKIKELLKIQQEMIDTKL